MDPILWTVDERTGEVWVSIATVGAEEEKTVSEEEETPEVEPGAEEERTVSEEEASPPGMVRVPEGTFLRGSETGQEDEKPAKEIHVDGFWIDEYEVTVSDYKAWTREGAVSHQRRLLYAIGTRSRSAPPRPRRPHRAR